MHNYWDWGGREGDRPHSLTMVSGYRRVATFFRPYVRDIVLALVSMVVISAFGLVPPLILKEAIDVAIPESRSTYLNVLVVGMVAIPLLSGFIGVAQSFLNTRVGQGVMRDLRTRLYAHLQRMDLGFFTHTRSGEVISRVTNDVSGVEVVVTGTFTSIATNLVTVVPTLAIMALLSWQLTLMSLALPPLFAFPTRKVGRIRRSLRRQSQERVADLSSQVQETLSVSGALLVRSFGQEEMETERFTARSQALMDVEIRRNLVWRWFFMFLGVVSAVGPALIYWYGGHQIIGGTMTLGGIIAFIAYQGRLFGPITSLLNIHVDLASALALFERIFEYLDLTPELTDSPDARPLPPTRGHMAFREVTFSYVPGLPVLRGVSFEVHPGQMAALVGPSGAGKTTISHLVPRLYDVDGGVVEIDGKDVRKVTLDSLRSQIGIVTQDVYLLNDTLRANLLYGRPDASEAEMQAAAETIGANAVVGVDLDYDTIQMGQGGTMLMVSASGTAVRVAW